MYLAFDNKMEGFVAEEIALDVIYLDKQSFYLRTAAAIKDNPHMLTERADKKPVPSCRAKHNDLFREGRAPACTQTGTGLPGQ